MRPLRIGSWNIRKAVGLDWRRDPARVLRVLGRMNLDIVIVVVIIFFPGSGT